MKTPNQKDLPNYGRSKSDNVILVSQTQYINPDNFFVNETSVNEQYVTFQASSVRLCFGSGSSTITFLKSLIACKDPDMFTTPLIRSYIFYK